MSSTVVRKLPAENATKGGADARTARVKDVVARALRGEIDAGDFTPAMQKFLGTATGKGFWQWFAAHGELGSFTESDREKTPDGETLRYRVLLGGNAYWLSVRLTGDGRIAQIYWW